MGLSDSEVNLDLLEYLRAQAQPGTGRREADLDGWEMHAHPDLIERLGDIAGSPHVVVPLYGVAVIVHNGVVAVVALGTDTLLFRLPQAPEGVEVEDHTEPLCSKGWHAVSPWQSQLPSAEGLRRLRKLLGKARHYADELNAAGT